MQKTDVKAWLKAIGKNRQWLAEQCGVTKRGVDAWLSSSRPIPRPAERIIERLISQYPATTSTQETPSNGADNAITLTIDDATFDTWNQAATVEGKLLRQWCVDIINDALDDKNN